MMIFSIIFFFFQYEIPKFREKIAREDESTIPDFVRSDRMFFMLLLPNIATVSLCISFSGQMFVCYPEHRKASIFNT